MRGGGHAGRDGSAVVVARVAVPFEARGRTGTGTGAGTDTGIRGAGSPVPGETQSVGSDFSIS